MQVLPADASVSSEGGAPVSGAGRLDTYDRLDLRPSAELEEAHREGGVYATAATEGGADRVVNEHGQQRYAAGYVADIPEPIDDISYKTKYTDISRQPAPLPQPEGTAAGQEEAGGVVATDISSVLEVEHCYFFYHNFLGSLNCIFRQAASEVASSEEDESSSSVVLVEEAPIRIEVEEVPLKPDPTLLGVLEELRTPVEEGLFEPKEEETYETTAGPVILLEEDIVVEATTAVPAPAEEKQSATTKAVVAEEVTTTRKSLFDDLEEELAVDVEAPAPTTTVPERSEVEDLVDKIEETLEVVKEVAQQEVKEAEREQTTTAMFITPTTTEEQQQAEQDTTTPKAVDQEEEEEVTTQAPGLLQSLFDYLLPSTTTTEAPAEEEETVPPTEVPETTSKVVEEVVAAEETTPQPKEAENEVLNDNEESEYAEEEAARAQHPKALDTENIIIGNEVQSDEEEKEEEQVIEEEEIEDTKEEEEEEEEKSDLEKLAKKRDELIKNWVSKKYKAKAKKKYHGVLLAPTTVAPSQDDQDPAEEEEDENDDLALLPFAPTIPPKNKYSSSSSSSSSSASDVGQDLISGKAKAKLTKLNSRKKLLLNKLSRKKQPKPTLQKPKKSKKFSRIPIGSDPNLFRKWGGDSLSQVRNN